ncbi:MAG TPA: lipopolysaccharide core heptose(I) kinase RfaP [Acidiferrobacteraceae bacterium]|nr:lipopolysaccharide core heptose(I) kinase RfaP [Acidiferrobacteraceae bacterium]
MTKFYVPPKAKKLFPECRSVIDFLAIKGKVIKSSPRRCVLRVERGGQELFIKIHEGVGWREIFKNLFNLRLPIVSAQTEYTAIRRLEALGVATMPVVAWGVQGWNPARRRSFIVTRSLERTVDLEHGLSDVLNQALNPASLSRAARKRRLIHDVASLTHRLHAHGVNHRDFYLCHLRVDREGPTAMNGPFKLYVMDLHRAQLRRRTPRRWIVKDLSALLYSMLLNPSAVAFTRRDGLRFIRAYTNMPWSHAVAKDAALWCKVVSRTLHMLRRQPFGILDAERHALQWLNDLPLTGSAYCLGRQGDAYINASLRQSSGLRNLLRSPDEIMATGEVLKADSTTTVVRVEADMQQWVIKRYKWQGGWAACRLLFRSSRSQRAWCNAHRLMRSGVETPRPIAALDRRISWHHGASYFISEYVAGERCREYFEQPIHPMASQAVVVENLIGLFRRLGMARLSHGDMKDTNIILRNNRPVLLDLEALRHHRSDWVWRWRFGRDVRRFLGNRWCDPELVRYLSEQLLPYSTRKQ